MPATRRRARCRRCRAPGRRDGHAPPRPACAERRRPRRAPAARCRGPRRRGRVARARTTRSDTRRGGRRRRRRSGTGWPQRMQYFESEACWRSVRARRGSSTPKRSAFSRPSASAPTSGSSAFATSVAPRVQAGNGVAPALGDVLELAVAVELVAEEVAEAHDARAACAASPRAARTRRPRAARAPRRPRPGGSR